MQNLLSCLRRCCLGAAGVALLSSGCNLEPQPSAPAAPSPQAPAVVDTKALLQQLPLARVISRDEGGKPRFFVGSTFAQPRLPGSMNGEQAARLQLMRHARVLGLTDAAVDLTQLTSAHALPAGASVLQFTQRAHGLEVFGARASVLLDANKHMVSLANHLSPAANAPGKRQHFASPVEQAAATAYSLQTGLALPAGAVVTGAAHGEWTELQLRTSAGMPRVIEAAARRVLFPEGSKLVPAYHVELLLRAAQGAGENQGSGYVVSAADQRALFRASLTASDTFHYRVWADARGVPADGPLADTTPHPSGKPDKVRPGPAAPVLVSVEGYNRNPDGKPDPWLGPSDTYTFGNNTRAYSDRDQFQDDAGIQHKDGFNEGSDLRAELTSANTFDRVYDLARGPDADPDQIKAAITQIFYTTNWLHDFWYDSGFDERSHNAQQSNYGRGGAEGDPLKAEAQDSANSGISNNANMSTFSDGRSPRMQMYVWSGLPNRKLETRPALTFEDGLGAAAFGPETFDLGDQELELVLAEDGSTEVAPDGAGMGSVTDACQPPTNVQGKLAVIDRGACTFVSKALNAQEAGAVALLVLDNAPGHTPPNPSLNDPQITIPLLSLSFEDGQKLKAALKGSTPVVATEYQRGKEVKRDGTIDNTIVAHEFGHYLHHRLVLCGSTTCDGMSEGWGDFTALLMAIRADDVFPGKAYPLAQYATGGPNPNGTYFGIRRAPYSVDLDKNPFTFQHVRKMSKLPATAPLAPTSPDMTEVHNVGEIWAQALFEAYVGLIEAGRKAGRPFEDTQRRMADYVVAGMKAAPVEPSFTEQRDAILSAVYASAKSDASRLLDFNALAGGFAKRGLGVGTVAPPTSSKTLDEAVESFAFKGEVAVKDIALDDSTRSCDRDGKLDAAEAGQLSFTVTNSGWLPLAQPRLQVISSDPAVTVEQGGFLQLGALGPYDEAQLKIGVSVAGNKRGRSLLKVLLKPSDPDAVNTDKELPFELLYNFDDAAASSSSDDVESANTAWATPLTRIPDVWKREGDAANHVWHGADIGTPSDEKLESPELQVSVDNPFILTFSHRYSFEMGSPLPNRPPVGFDGAVLEISADGGTTWQDISEYADPGYTDKVFSTALLAEEGLDEPPDPDTNPLAGRMAWLGESPGYPAYSTLSLNLGKKLAGKAVKIRFRIGTDEGTGDAGWDIDNIVFGTSSFSSITNKPFGSLRDDPNACSAAELTPAASSARPAAGR